jgi:hypothetical protein
MPKHFKHFDVTSKLKNPPAGYRGICEGSQLAYPDRCNCRGSCARNTRCPCRRNLTTCRPSCGCSASCCRRFPPCKCRSKCGGSCTCRKWGRECSESCGLSKKPHRCQEMSGHRQAIETLVEKSTISGAGNGLFATNGAKFGDFIGEYSGQIKPIVEQPNLRRSTQRQSHMSMMDIAKGIAIHVNKKNPCPVYWINDSQNKPQYRRYNARFCAIEGIRGRIILVYATRRIRPGGEIFLKYTADALTEF